LHPRAVVLKTSRSGQFASVVVADELSNYPGIATVATGHKGQSEGGEKQDSHDDGDNRFLEMAFNKKDYLWLSN
jgi:hypothetical protein